MNHSGIHDEGMRFQIVPSTRKIVVPAPGKIIGVAGEHLCEQVTFECPKIIEGHSIKECTAHYVSWENANGKPGNDRLKLVEETDGYLVYAWDIRNNTTVKAGIVAISVHFECVSDDGTLLYRFSTHRCEECEILDSVNAPVGVYDVCVEGNKLVFADYIPVRDGSLMLESNKAG